MHHPRHNHHPPQARLAIGGVRIDERLLVPRAFSLEPKNYPDCYHDGHEPNHHDSELGPKLFTGHGNLDCAHVVSLQTQSKVQNKGAVSGKRQEVDSERTSTRWRAVRFVSGIACNRMVPGSSFLPQAWLFISPLNSVLLRRADFFLAQPPRPSFRLAGRRITHPARGD